MTENFVGKVNPFEVKNNTLNLKNTTEIESMSVDDGFWLCAVFIAPVYFAQFTEYVVYKQVY